MLSSVMGTMLPDATAYAQDMVDSMRAQVLPLCVHKWCCRTCRALLMALVCLRVLC